ncbi:hypothetical protein [Duganella callida]|uniref:Uncharacterized protein n=1 Tax=Duganella callida TaxID=2561932 RepID=A0A4Y9SQ74_9BURK|nr:hypothetical protein [Duganella callida]TFW26536.1 hypothetical protein E4L98_08545 [Duganella callida]
MKAQTNKNKGRSAVPQKLKTWTSIKSYLSIKTIFSTLGLSAAGLWAYFSPFTDPLKQSLAHKLYKESPSIQISCSPCAISPGESTRINVEISPNSVADIDKGVVKIRYDKNIFILSSDTPPSFETEAINSRRRLDKYFALYLSKNATNVSSSEIRASLATKYGEYDSDALSISLAPPQSTAELPYIDPNGRREVILSGEWRIEIGGSLGGMKITQDQHNDITGTYWLNSPTGRIESQIEGYKDGTSFKVFFLRPKSQSRWRIDANFALNVSDKSFIEMTGCAFSLKPDKTVQSDSSTPIKGCAVRNYPGWRGDGSTTFTASAQLRDSI